MTTVETLGFAPQEQLVIRAANLAEASRTQGQQTRRQARNAYNKLTQDLTPRQLKHGLVSAEKSLAKMRALAVSDSATFTVGGINHLAKYLNIFDAYHEGAQLTPAECALLQMEGQTGCQTMIVQNLKTGEIVAAGTEEDQDWELYSRHTYPYRLADVSLDDGTEIVSFTYPGLCGLGHAVSVNKTTGMIQYADTLSPREGLPTGSLWINALAFMTFNCKNLSQAQKLINQYKQHPEIYFVGGDAIHLIQGNDFLSVEALGNQIEINDPTILKGRVTISQGNYPNHPSLQAIDANQQTKGEPNPDLALYERNARRLSKITTLVGTKFDRPGWAESLRAKKGGPE